MRPQISSDEAHRIAFGFSPQRSVSEARLHDGRVTDAAGGTIGLHRPGYRVADNAAMRDAREEAYEQYQQYQRELTSAWRRGPVHDAEREEEEEETCDVLPLRDGVTLDEAERVYGQRMAREYERYDDWIEQQWCNR